MQQGIIGLRARRMQEYFNAEAKVLTLNQVDVWSLLPFMSQRTLKNSAFLSLIYLTSVFLFTYNLLSVAGNL